MIDLKITTNLKDVTASLTRFAAEHQKAAVRALNQTAIQARNAASKEVRAAGYGIKASAIKKSFAIERASTSNLTVTLRSTGAPIGLINYNARQTKSGVSIQVKNGRQTLKHAFVRTMPSGHIGVFERVGSALAHRQRPASPTKMSRNGRVIAAGKKRAGLIVARGAGPRKKRTSNLPIKELFGPSIPSAVANPAVLSAIQSLIKTQFPKLLAHELRYEKLKK